MLPLVPPFEELLHRLKQEQLINQKVCGNAYCQKYLDYIYVNAIGELVKPNFITQHFEIVLKNNGLKKIRFHDASVIIGLSRQALAPQGVALI